MHNAISSGGALLFKACRPICVLRSVSSTPPFFGPRFVKNKLTYYEILGIERDASATDIRSAFLKLSKDYHPDVNTEDPQNHEKFVEINEAYSILSKPLARREYDNDLLYGSMRRNPNTTRQTPQSSDVNNHSNFSSEGPYYHDPQFYQYRDKSQDAYYSSKPYYGIRGISKLPNKVIVYVCMAILVIGAAFHFFVVKMLSDIHIENLNARDRRNHELWQKAKDPDNISQQLQLMKIMIKEKEEKKRQQKDD